jgi:hypothetical protein
MTVKQLHRLLLGNDGTRRLVSAPKRDDGLARQVWRAAQDEADAAYAAWRDHRGIEGYLAYRAAADRADAALDALVGARR